MKDTIEKITCDAILQNPTEIEVAGKKYVVAPPTAGTLIEVSKYISQLPEIKVKQDGNIVMETLSVAKDFECMGDIIAILMLGKKNLVAEKRYLFGLIKYKIDHQKKLANELLLSLSAEELHELLSTLLKMLKVDFFFATSTFLQEINLLKKTKMSETTVSGQSSQE